MTHQRERLTKRRRQVLAYIDEHGEISGDDVMREFGVQIGTAHQILDRMHTAKLIRVKRWQRGRQGPVAPFFVRADGQPDMRRPPNLTAAAKARRYRQRLRDGQPVTPRTTQSIFDLLVVQPLRRSA